MTENGIPSGGFEDIDIVQRKLKIVKKLAQRRVPEGQDLLVSSEHQLLFRAMPRVYQDQVRHGRPVRVKRDGRMF